MKTHSEQSEILPTLRFSIRVNVFQCIHNAARRTSTSHCRTAGNRRLSFMVFYDFVFRILCENDASASTYVSPSMLSEQTPHCERHHCIHRFQLGFDTGGVRFSLRQCSTQYILVALEAFQNFTRRNRRLSFEFSNFWRQTLPC